MPQQFEVGDAVSIVGQNNLLGIPSLGNMMGNVNYHDASKAGHYRKISERTRFAAELPRNLWLGSNFVPALGQRNGERPVCPQVFPTVFHTVFPYFVGLASAGSFKFTPLVEITYGFTVAQNGNMTWDEIKFSRLFAH